MSVLEKLGLVQGSGEPEIHPNKRVAKGMELPPLPVVPTIPPETIVDVQAVYNSTGLGDVSKSIFKVEEMKAAMETVNPNMPEAQRKASVVALLPSSGLVKEVLIGDGQSRINVLNDAKTISAGDTKTKIDKAQEQINQLTLQVEEAKTQISAWTKNQEDLDHAFNTEIQKINALIAFLS